MRIIFRHQSHYLVESYKTQTTLLELLTDSTAKYAYMFNKFFKDSTTTSPYKPLFLSALTDLYKYGSDDLVGKQWVEKKDGKIKLQLDFIAARFAKYYWDMEVTFKMRHIPKRMANDKNPKQDVNMVKLVRKKITEMHQKHIETHKQELSKIIDKMSLGTLLDEKQFQKQTHVELKLSDPPTLEKLSSDSMKEFREHIIEEGIKLVVLRKLHQDMKAEPPQDVYLYDVPKNANYIVLDDDFIPFVQNFAPVIKKALNYHLALHFEKNNPAIRHVATKLNDEMELEQKLEYIRKLENKAEKND